MKKIECVVVIAFVAAVLLGYGCTTDDERHQILDLGGEIYAEKFSCNQAFTGQPPFCSDLNETDELQFERTGSNTYEVRNVPNTGFVINGTLVGLTFFWSATSPNGYTETGTWTFTSGGGSFSGPSHYRANNGSYSGDCNTNGDRGLSSAPDPPLPPACP